MKKIIKNKRKSKGGERKKKLKQKKGEIYFHKW